MPTPPWKKVAKHDSGEFDSGASWDRLRAELHYFDDEVVEDLVEDPYASEE